MDVTSLVLLCHLHAILLIRIELHLLLPKWWMLPGKELADFNPAIVSSCPEVWPMLGNEKILQYRFELDSFCTR
jgi:hypothetical protein